MRAVNVCAIACLVGCGTAVTSQPSAEEPAPARAPLSCAELAPCDRTLGVCLRCDRPNAPSWEWSDAPGSAWTLSIRSDLLPSPDPGLDARGLAHPFSRFGPDCRRFELDAEGFPVRTRAGDEPDDAFEWIYDDRHRLVEIRMDEVPFCPANEWGDQAPCGVPDGHWDATTRFVWEDLAGGGSRVLQGDRELRRYDEEGRLVSGLGGDDRGTVEHVYEDGRLARTHTPDEDIAFRYDPAGRVVELRLRGAQAAAETVFQWAYDAAGNPTEETIDGHRFATYTNTYEDGLLRLVRQERFSTPRVQVAEPRELEIRLEYDAHGLLVRAATSARGALITETRWRRAASGAPLGKAYGPNDEDYRCLDHLLPRFVRATR